MTPRRTASVLRALFACLALLLAAGYAAADSPPVLPSGLDGLQIKNAKTPLEGVTSGGQPTEDELRQAAGLGYQTVVNLRTEGEEMGFEEAEFVKSLGLKYISLPIAGAEGITSENAAALAKILEDSTRPILLHCGSGNRVGALFALNAHANQGQDAEAALQIGLDAGLTGLEPAVREMLGLPAPASEE